MRDLLQIRLLIICVHKIYIGSLHINYPASIKVSPYVYVFYLAH